MEVNLISKKDLLEMTGISYGQLYRWKRKSLIPEDWFIRKSTYTGQETFFPREKILSRIDRIVNMKDDVSLDDLADLFSPGVSSETYTTDQLIERNIVTRTGLETYLSTRTDPGVFDFDKLLLIYVLDQLLASGEIGLEESQIPLQMLEEHYSKYAGQDCELICLRKLGVSTCLLRTNNGDISFEGGIRVVLRLSINDCVEKLKTKLK